MACEEEGEGVEELGKGEARMGRYQATGNGYGVELVELSQCLDSVGQGGEG